MKKFYRPTFLYNPEPGAGDPPANPTPTGGGEERKFTQADLDRIAGETRKQGRDTAQRELMETLGVKNLDELKQALAERQKLAEGQKSEMEKAVERAARAERERDETRAEAKRATLIADAKVAAVGLKFKADKIDKVLKLVEIKTDSTPESVKAELEALVKEMPELLETAATTPPPPPNTSAANPNKTNSGGAESAKDWYERMRNQSAINSWASGATLVQNPKNGE